MTLQYHEALSLLSFAPQRIVTISCLTHAVEKANRLNAEVVISFVGKRSHKLLPQFGTASLNDHRIYLVEDAIEEILPEMERAVRSIVLLGKNWRERQAIPRTLIHCHGGVSRSVAAAYVLLCATFPNTNPVEHLRIITDKLTYKSFPNLLIAQLADDMLNANGAMLRPIVEYQHRHPKRLAAHIRRQRMSGFNHCQHV